MATINGDQNANIIVGTDVGDLIYGKAGDDVISGAGGNDSVYGDAGNDVLDGGTGNDILSGGAGNDTYLFGYGGGQDSISNYDTGAGRVDVLRFADAVATTDVRVTRNYNDLIVTLTSTGDKVTVGNHFYNDGAGGYALNHLVFADGTVWDYAALQALAATATEGADNLYGDAGNNVLSGLGGNDYLYGRAGNDVLEGGFGADNLYGEDGNDNLNGGSDNDYVAGGNGDDFVAGGAGNDNVYGDAGNDVLDGGTGNDNLSGGAGNDTYLFGYGGGQDSISNYDADASSVDIARFDGNGLQDLLFSRLGNDLLVARVGSADQVSVYNWYSNQSYQLDQIEIGADIITNSQINQLVSAMAAFAPAVGVSSLSRVGENDHQYPVLAVMS